MTSLQAIGFTLAGGTCVSIISIGAFGIAVRNRHYGIAPRCTARPKDTVYNPHPVDKSQMRGNAWLGWIPWTLSLSYETMLRGVPGTGTRKNGLKGALLNVNLDAIILFRFNALCMRISLLTTILVIVIILPLNWTARDDYNEISYNRTTLANIPSLGLTTKVTSADLFAASTFFEKLIVNLKTEPNTQIRLYIIVICSWIVTYYVCIEIGKEWKDNLALRRKHYFEVDHHKKRKGELKKTLLRSEDVNFHKRRDPWIPHPEQRDTVPNVELYSVLVGDLPSLPNEIVEEKDLEATIGFTEQQKIDWQLAVATTFFDHCVPNQPGFSSSVAAVTILPHAAQLAAAWRKWYTAAAALRRLRFIRSVIADRRYFDLDEVSDHEPAGVAESRNIFIDDDYSIQQSVDVNSMGVQQKVQYFREFYCNEEVETQFMQALNLGPEQTAVYSREFAQGAANCCPNGCAEGRVRHRRIDELLEMESEAVQRVQDANRVLRSAQAKAGNFPTSTPKNAATEEQSDDAHQVQLPLQHQQHLPMTPSNVNINIANPNSQESYADIELENMDHNPTQTPHTTNLSKPPIIEQEQSLTINNHTSSTPRMSHTKKKIMLNDNDMVLLGQQQLPPPIPPKITKLSTSNSSKATLRTSVQQLKDKDFSKSLKMETDFLEKYSNSPVLHEFKSTRRISDPTARTASSPAINSNSIDSLSFSNHSLDISFLKQSDTGLHSESTIRPDKNISATATGATINSNGVRPNNLPAIDTNTSPIVERRISFSNQNDIKSSPSVVQQQTLSNPANNTAITTTINTTTTSSFSTGRFLQTQSCGMNFNAEGQIVLNSNIEEGNSNNILSSSLHSYYPSNSTSSNNSTYSNNINLTHRRNNTKTDGEQQQSSPNSNHEGAFGYYQQNRKDGVWSFQKSVFSYKIFKSYIVKNVQKIFCKRVARVANGLHRSSTIAIVTFTSRQAAVAARHCLADGRGASRWVALDNIPVPPLADAAPCDLLTCRGCCRPVTLSIPKQQQVLRKWCSTVILIVICIFYTIPITFISNLFNIEQLEALSPKFYEKVSQSVIFANILSGIVPATLQSLFFSVCPMIFKAIANFGSNATSVSEAELCAMKYYWWFMVTIAFTGNTLATSALNALSEGLKTTNIPSIFESIANTVPVQLSSIWMNWIILRFTIILPIQYLLQFNTFLFLALGWRCCARCVMGGGTGGPLPYRIYIDTGTVFMCLVSLSFASPLIAPFCFIYFLTCEPVWRRNSIFLYRPKYDGGGFRWPFLSEICFSCVFLSQVLLTTMLGLKNSVGPACLAGVTIIPTYMFRKLTKTKYHRAYEDAGLLQTSLLDMWDTSHTASPKKREEFRRFLVDAHKAAYIPVCISGTANNILTTEPAVVVPLENDVLPRNPSITGNKDLIMSNGMNNGRYSDDGLSVFETPRANADDDSLCNSTSKYPLFRSPATYLDSDVSVVQHGMSFRRSQNRHLTSIIENEMNGNSIGTIMPNPTESHDSDVHGRKYV